MTLFSKAIFMEIVKIISEFSAILTQQQIMTTRLGWFSAKKEAWNEVNYKQREITK